MGKQLARYYYRRGYKLSYQQCVTHDTVTSTDLKEDTSHNANLLMHHIFSMLEDNKAEDVVTIDLSGKSSMADYMVVASGYSKRHVISICDKIIESLKINYNIRASVEGKQKGDWVLVDAGDVIIHLFRPEVREYYQLEKMWRSDTLLGQNG